MTTPTTLQNAIDSLYTIAVVDQKSTSTRRLSVLADACVAGLGRRGLSHAETEACIPGGGRPKDWDVAWQWSSKYRLVISLKSILKNISGTVPNRLDDVMGETANIQMYSPEIVTGYVMIFDAQHDTRAKEGRMWSEIMQDRLARISGRRSPYWTPGTFESHAVVVVDFSHGPQIVSGQDSFERMLDELADETKQRNPGIGTDIQEQDD